MVQAAPFHADVRGPPPPGPPWNAANVEWRLLAAGRTMVAWRVDGVWPGGFRSGMPDYVREVDEGYRLDDEPAVDTPSRRALDDMFHVITWVSLIPADRIVFRRIVAARMLCKPHLDKPMLSWRAIAAKVGASHEAVRVWHGQAIGMIVDELNRPGFCRAGGGKAGLTPAQRGDVNAAMRRLGRQTGRLRELA